MQQEATLTVAVDVYVPAPWSALARIIDAHSGIVGTPIHQWFKDDEDPEDGLDGVLVIDYEGNRFNAANIRTYADRVMQAAGRHVVHYPTVARQTVPNGGDDLLRVGVFLPRERVIAVADDASMAHLAAWLGYVEDDVERLPDVDIDLAVELRCSR